MIQSAAPSKRSPAGVFLIGFMGCGKSTVGDILSRELGWKFEDLDARLESRQNCSIPLIFSNHGEQRFRELERAALLELIGEMGARPTVAALGGGTFVLSENRVVLKDSGWPIIFLDGKVEDLWKRCRSADAQRPLAQDKNQFQQLYEARRRFYMEAASTVDTTGKTPESIAREIIAWLQTGLPKERQL